MILRQLNITTLPIFQAGVDAQARVQLVGEADNIISEYSLVNGEAINIEIQRDDEVPLISTPKSSSFNYY